MNIQKQIDDFILEAKILSPIGIIINELFTNAMKYAFTGRDSGLIRVSASLAGNRATIIIEDNGNGLSDSIDIEKPGGFGLQLVGLLAKQIHGSIKIERHNGTRFVLEFKV